MFLFFICQPVESGAASGVANRKLRLLVVDDVKSNRKMLRHTLEKVSSSMSFSFIFSCRCCCWVEEENRGDDSTNVCLVRACVLVAAGSHRTGGKQWCRGPEDGRQLVSFWAGHRRHLHGLHHACDGWTHCCAGDYLDWLPWDDRRLHW